ncbi:RHS repeat domain-containing protein, partial [Tenacibaculum maritimum]|uniref:RHS repeat domain-containing protein n=1 Tax=Tenacibaculum maritimum TaxID=107401 RepID=UPI003876BBED
YKSIDYAIYIHASKVYIYEKGSFRGVETSYKVGDVFQVERIGSEVFYKKNGAIFYKSTIPSSGSLLGDVSMFHKGGEIRDLKLVDNTKGLQKIDYSYNIRGWLKKINEDGFKDNDLFNFTINYNSIEGNAGASGKAIPLYNGNISQTIWSSKSTDQTKRAYEYKYDALNRLSVAYSRKGHDLNTADKYSMWLDYDKNGNINRLFRNGVHNTIYGRVDDLSYSYIGNQLTKVTENGSSLIKSEGFKDVNNAIDYTYDVNGNMTKDLNKGITDIIYNHLNLPTKIHFRNGGSIDYKYDARGVKLEKEARGEYGDPSSTQYAGNYIYKKNPGRGTQLKLAFFNHPEGYVSPKNASDISQGFKYVYQYKDHLGNVRLSYTDQDKDGVIRGATSQVFY